MKFRKKLLTSGNSYTTLEYLTANLHDAVVESLEEEAKRVDEASATVTYVGYIRTVSAATSAAFWKIKRISVSGTETIIDWADGNQEYDNVWDSRAALTYL